MPDAAVLLAAPNLSAVPHAFSTRRGGVSKGPFESLNFGNPGETPPEARDPIANIRENWRRSMELIGASGRQLVEVHQVHGAVVHEVRPGEPAHPQVNDTRADAIVTDDPTRLVAVRIADCAPVLISSIDGRVVAAVHAGWRGVISGIVNAALAAMRRIAPESCAAGLVAAIGPCIGPGAFEVGPEVASEFARVFGVGTPHLRAGQGDRSLVDIPGALGDQLRSAGVGDVAALNRCTFSEPEWFFSHRLATHQRRLTGRMAAMIGPRR